MPDVASSLLLPAVLIVDDEPMLRSVIQEYLELIGYGPAAVAGNGREALDQLRASHFDCMISDVRMPEMHLEELLPIVRAEFPDLVVIASSGHSDTASAMEILNQGAHDFLGKPLDLKGLEIALDWVAVRGPILKRAGVLFDAGLNGGAPGMKHAALDSLREVFVAASPAFAAHLAHSVRMAALARALAPSLPAQAAIDLELAALLHEMGFSRLMHSLIEKTRKLDDLELSLVRSHARVGGQIVAACLGQPRFAEIIGSHLQWGTLDVGKEPAASPTVLAAWLGLINFVDGCLRARPDRAAFSLGQVAESLRRRHAASKSPIVAAVLKHWPAIEGLYPALGASA